MAETFEIKITGLVQGVGFRPFVYRIATQNGLMGWVNNRSDGVVVRVNTDKDGVERFISQIRGEAPPASEINHTEYVQIDNELFTEFSIIKSEAISGEITEVSPDIALCVDCLNDMKHQKHRIRYPFVNCTNCGPRFTIIRDLPYDRPKTTMSSFEMCDTCNKEYTDILDRRFHAQPVACNTCGPQLMLLPESELRSTDEIVSYVAARIDDGEIAAIKGMGGFFVACDAENQSAVVRLRAGKQRESKPFALMFRDTETLKHYARVSPSEEALLQSWRRPVVLLEKIKEPAPAALNGLKYIGAMLPYMPIHYLLFEKLKCSVLVMTSGNISDEPIVIDDKTALSTLKPVAYLVLGYNREIHNRVDDSVAFCIGETVHLMRRSRGYTPSPVRLPMRTEGIFAAGAELVNCFAIGKGNQAIMSQHIGDLKNAETLDFYTESAGRYLRLFQCEPEVFVADLHPDYLSTRFARESGKPVIFVQHHHAHIASVMAACGISDKVIGVSFDGTGLGTDGTIWGGEFMVADFNDFERLFHLEYIPLPGGDSVTKQPWRTALSWIIKCYGALWEERFSKLFPEIQIQEAQILAQAIHLKINSPVSSAAGRLFDAVAAIIGACTEASFHAEAPMRLENLASAECSEIYPFQVNGSEIMCSDIISAIVSDRMNGIPVEAISTQFHHTMAIMIQNICEQIRATNGISEVALTGGVFQNRILLQSATTLLTRSGFQVLQQSKVPLNDGGIALGQLAIAAARRG
ncbi:MAG: carbamoyltransferase HypF [Bacteroidetes bacterium]|nr:carbamoyltransferase HypF [Bacteroidota bacterium]